MNTKAINELIEQLKAMPHKVVECGEKNDPFDPKFNLAKWVHPCGAPACIAGHAVFNDLAKQHSNLIGHALLERYQRLTHSAEFDWYYDGAKALGISYNTAIELFAPYNYSIFPNGHGAAWTSSDRMRQLLTPAMIIKVLEHLKETGRVDWTIIAEEVRPLLNWGSSDAVDK